MTTILAAVGDGLAQRAWDESELKGIAQDLSSIRVCADYLEAFSSERGFGNQFGDELIAMSPRQRAQKREQAFGDEQQGDGTEDDVPERDALQAGYFLGGNAGVAPEPRIALKKSLLGSTIIRSDLLRKLARYASRLR